MTILDEIIARKKTEVAAGKAAVPIARLEQSPLFGRQPLSFRNAIGDPARKGIIAEFKRCSPSEGVINDTADLLQVTSAYTHAGASALSVLTDTAYFGGSSQDLELARQQEHIAILRKEFIVDEYQVFEARAIGADAILLIAAALTVKEVLLLSLRARSLGLEVLLELHTEEELGHLNPFVDVVGVNNRNLATFKTSLQTSLDLYPALPAEMFKVAESGIHTPADVKMLKEAGFDGCLVGTAFMKQPNPGRAFLDFIKQC